jgi:hypothetical protein
MGADIEGEIAGLDEREDFRGRCSVTTEITSSERSSTYRPLS